MQDLQSKQRMQIESQYLALAARGVKHFPRPSLAPSQKSQDQGGLGEDLFLSFSQCQECLLSKTRKNVSCAPSYDKKKFMVICDFPAAHFEDGELFPKVIVNLLEKLGIAETTHISFALKCFPERGLAESFFSTCIAKNLHREVAAVQPEVVFFFGKRAIKHLFDKDTYFELQECEELKQKKLFGRSGRGFVFPDARELQEFPMWRAKVWEMLLEFKRS